MVSVLASQQEGPRFVWAFVWHWHVSSVMEMVMGQPKTYTTGISSSLSLWPTFGAGSTPDSMFRVVKIQSDILHIYLFTNSKTKQHFHNSLWKNIWSKHAKWINHTFKPGSVHSSSNLIRVKHKWIILICKQKTCNSFFFFNVQMTKTASVSNRCSLI